MFYYHDVLQRRGRFGIIWLAATAPKKLNRREYMGVNIKRTSDEILDILTGNVLPYPGTQKHVRFSLYLSSQLLFGLIRVNQKLCDYLLEDVRLMQARISTFLKPDEGNINLKNLIKSNKVTVEDARFLDVPIEFGRLDMMLDEESIVVFQSDDFFSVPTPRGSSLMSGSSGSGVPQRVEELHVVDAAEVTMIEDVVIPDQNLEQQPVMIPGDDLPVDDADLFSHPSAYPPFPIVPISDADVMPRELPDPSTITEDLMGMNETTPTVPITLPEPVRPERAATAPELDITRMEMEEAAAEKKKRRRISLPGDDGSVNFILEDIVAAPKKRKHRHLVVDDITCMSRDEIRNNISQAQNAALPFHHLPILETLDMLFNRFGSRIAAKGKKDFWKPLKTLSEPTDTTRFGGQEFSTGMEGVEQTRVTFQEQLLEDFQDAPSEVERLREISDSSGLSKIGLSKSDSISQRVQDASQFEPETTSVYDSTKEPLQPATSLMETILEEAEIQETVLLNVEQEQQIEIGVETETVLPPQEVELSPAKQVCIQLVSPERTPPPMSPEAPQSPTIETTMKLCVDTFKVCPVPGLITFEALFANRIVSRKTVAKSFFNMLSEYFIFISSSRFPRISKNLYWKSKEIAMSVVTQVPSFRQQVYAFAVKRSWLNLEEFLHSFLHFIVRMETFPQQDNASIHTSNSTKQWIGQKQVIQPSILT